MNRLEETVSLKTTYHSFPREQRTTSGSVTDGQIDRQTEMKIRLISTSWFIKRENIKKTLF